mmetsp:Transcript_2081/g.6181  ORF Transcript_2081/g.6181 Transcript_2081/m.6181 type:complete len:301 (-) Transcript_2081:100-1002(-)
MARHALALGSRTLRRFAGASRRRGAATDAFSDLEHEMWQRGATAYDAGFGPLTSQAAPTLVDAALGGLDATRATVLDVATGPGFVADEAASRGCEVVALDFSSEMLALAEPLTRKHAKLTLKQGDAQALPFADESFDAVTVAFGLLHLPRPEDCLREAFRVLQPGGKLSFSVWDKPAEGEGFNLVQSALAEGDPDVKLPGGDGVLPFFHFADAVNSSEALRDAGFETCVTARLPLVARLAAVDDLFDMFATGTARTRAILEQQTSSQLAAIRAAMAAGVARHAAADGYEVPMPAVCVSSQ